MTHVKALVIFPSMFFEQPEKTILNHPIIIDIIDYFFCSGYIDTTPLNKLK